MWHFLSFKTRTTVKHLYCRSVIDPESNLLFIAYIFQEMVLGSAKFEDTSYYVIQQSDAITIVILAFSLVLIWPGNNNLIIKNLCVLFDWGLIPFTQKGAACLLQAFTNRIIAVHAAFCGSRASVTLRHYYTIFANGMQKDAEWFRTHISYSF